MLLTQTNFLILRRKMPKKIASSLKQEAVILHLSGEIRDEISEKTGLSKGTVSNTIQEFSTKLVEGDFEAVTNHARFLRKNDVKWQDSVKGFHIFNLLKRLGVDDDKLLSFLSDVYTPFQESGLEPSDFIKYATILFRLQKKIDVPIEDIKEYNEELLKQKLTLEEGIDHLKKQANNAEQECKHALNKKKVTLEKLDSYNIIKAELAKFNLSINDLTKLSKMLKAAQSTRWNLDKIIEQLEKQDQYKSKIANLQKNEKTITEQLQSKLTKVDYLDQTITSKKNEEAKLESACKTLQRQKQALESSIRMTAEFSQKQLDESLKYAKNSISKSKSEATDAIAELSDVAKTEIGQFVDDGRKKFEQTVYSMDDSLTKFLTHIEKVGELKTIRPILKLMDSKGQPYEIYPIVITLLERLKIIHKTNNKHGYGTIRTIDRLISDLKSELNRIPAV